MSDRSGKRPTGKNSSDRPQDRPPRGQNHAERASEPRDKDQIEMQIPPARSFSEQFLPFIWGAVALFLTICFILDVISGDCAPADHLMGYAGYWICRALFGMFGGAAFALPVVCGAIAFSWRRYYRERLIPLQILLSVLFLLLLSGFVHVCVCHGNTYYLISTPNELFRLGAARECGGVLGSWIGWLMYKGLRLFGSIVLMVIAMPFLVLFLIGITPAELFLKLSAEGKAMRERRLREREAVRAEQRINREEERQARHEERIEAIRREREENAERRAARRAAAEVAAVTATTETDAADAPKQNEQREKRRSRRAAESEENPVLVIDPDTGEVLDTPAAPAEAEMTPPERPQPERMEIDFEDEPEEALQEPVEDASADAPKDTPVVDESDPLAAIPVRRSRHRKENPEKIEVTVLPSETAALTDTPDNPVGGLPEEEVVAGGVERPEAPAYVFPPIDLLTRGSSKFSADESQIQKNTQILQSTLESFKIRVKSISCSCGPTVTRYEVKPEAGVRVRSIANLVDDIAMNLAKAGVRIEAPIPGKSAVGIEVPNDNPSTVYLRNLLETPEFRNGKSRITSCLGCEVSGRPVIFDINKMPHLLVSGTTGSGKSVCINSIILSILYKAKPEEVKLILVDPKKVEFSMYRDIPHLYCPIVTDPKKAAGALYSAVAEMERRFELIEEVGVRNLAGYNEITVGDNEHPPMPQMIIIIDELADLMMTAPSDVENAICRLAQKGRAAGIHLILGTQRPSVDVITGLIKANVPSRIAFTVKSQVDSRTIIDVAGAEKLIGRGDMLYAPVGSTKPLRVQGAFVSDSEVEKVVEYVKAHNPKPVYDEEFMMTIDAEAARCGTGKKKSDDQISIDDLNSAGSGEDPKFWEAVEVAVEANKVSTSLLQRRLGLGYGRAAKVIDRMQEMGFVSPADGNKPRRVLITPQDLAEVKMNLR